MKVEGEGARRAFRDEPGGHRFQQIPRTERKGRVHSSTITVAVMREPSETEFVLHERDLEMTATRGSGAGGQSRQKNDTAVILKHKPSGLTVRSERERSQHQNKQVALGLLRARLWEAHETERASKEASSRRIQLGSGQRGDKVRTYRDQDDTAIDHRTGKKTRLERIRQGHLEDFQE